MNKINIFIRTLCTAFLTIILIKDNSKAQVLTFEQAKKQAEMGDAYSQAVVALYFQLGWNTQRDTNLAVKYANLSAKACHPLGQYRLGALLRDGVGNPKNDQRGLALQKESLNGLKSMAERENDPYAITALGILIYQGKVLENNSHKDERYKKAAKLFRAAADMGYGVAEFNYGVAFKEGYGVPKNDEVALRYLTKAINNQYPPAKKYVIEKNISLDERNFDSQSKQEYTPAAVEEVDIFPPIAYGNKEALLIANADYSHFAKLPNPIKDARQLGGVLSNAGFNVKILENANRENMLIELSAFEERLRKNQGIAFFHYGGHGIQVEGKNYLIPADAEIPDERRVATRALELDEIMTALDASGSIANVVILDACRDNPLPASSTRATTRGLSVVARKPKNSIIIYAAEAGSVAEDGLFTPTLSQVLASSPSADISELMKAVRKKVFDASGGTQTPGEYSQLFNRLCLSSNSASVVDGNIQEINSSNATIKTADETIDIAPLDDQSILSKVSSYWRHNGSVIGLISEGNTRTLVYVDPNETMTGLVNPGTVLFTGTSDGKFYRGTASRFRKGMSPNKYQVSGPIEKNGARIILNGTVYLRDKEGDFDSKHHDSLVFDFISKKP